jgi:RecB family exonuclease
MPQLLHKFREKYHGQAFSEEEVKTAKKMTEAYLDAWSHVAIPFVTVNREKVRAKFILSKKLLGRLV